MIEVDRRQLLRAGAGGLALLTMPRWLAGCAKGVSTSGPLPENPFLAWFGIDESIISQVMAELVVRGADNADIFFQHSRSTSVELEDGLISRANTSIDQGVGLRVVVGDQTGYAFTEDLSLEAMLAAARTAASIARGQAAVAPQSWQHREASGMYTLAVPWSEVGIDQKLPRIEALAQKAKVLDPSIQKVSVSWSDGEERVLVATMGGQILTDYRPMTRLWATITAEKNGVTQSNSSNVAGRRGFDWYTDAMLDKVATEAVDRTMRLFDARRPPAGEMPVILAAGASGILLHEAIGHGMEADFNRKGISIYSDMIGKPVAPDFCTIVDAANIPNERGSLNIDDEGNPAGHTVLVEKGILRGYLHDNISAKHYGVTPTGSGRRQSFRFPPMPRMSCTFMEDGPHSAEEIIGSVQKGIIAETFTNGQVQIGAGDFTFYIKNGWLIEGGKITAPIKDCNIIGNGPDALRKVTMAANDGKLDTGGWTCGKDGQSVPVSQGLPTVLVSSLTVGGENVG